MTNDVEWRKEKFSNPFANFFLQETSQDEYEAEEVRRSQKIFVERVKVKLTWLRCRGGERKQKKTNLILILNPSHSPWHVLVVICCCSWLQLFTLIFLIMSSSFSKFSQLNCSKAENFFFIFLLFAVHISWFNGFSCFVVNFYWN
jgi:hypothetical protein